MTKLPLHRLLAQLRAAGFDITAREWYRVEIALSQNQQLLYTEEGWQELGLILGPLLCRNEKQQELFGQIYQQYLRDLPKGGKTVIQTVEPPKRAPWWLPAALAVGLLLLAQLLLNWYKDKYSPAIKFEQFKYSYDLGEGDFHAEDTIRLINNTAAEDTAGLTFYWYLKDEADRVLVDFDQFDHPGFVFDPDESVDHKLGFIVRKDGIPFYSGDEKSFRVFCKDGPEIVGQIQVEGARRPNDALQFSVETKGADFAYQWVFAPGDTLREARPVYAFAEAGRYQISVEVYDTTSKNGYCQDVATYTLEIEEDQTKPTLVSMPSLTLKKDPEGISYTFPFWVYLLAVLFPLLAAVFWVLWYYQRKHFSNKKKEEREARLADLTIQDKAPYEIPFENREGEINKTPLQFSMANVLRRRQEGSRQMLDVPRTIERTVGGGGYLDLQFRYNTRPTDYLFLIDEASAESHLARLFMYLTETLRDQDVHVDYWTYRGHFDRFWNPAYQGFLTLEQLQKNYSDRKLIVFGNADELLDLNRSKDTIDTFESWKYRLLVTPRPLSSWSSKEKQLYRYFPVFPANLQSLMEAVRLIEKEWEPEDLPAAFNDWKNQLERKVPEDPDSDIRWRHWPEYKNYLKRHPELLPWLKALVVHPELRWDLTIAIGKALDAPVTFDNLLILSRIPAFTEGRFPVRVWREIWPQLDLEQEWIARRKVKSELEAISAEAVQGSYAERELKTDLALQNFALEPHDPTFQEDIRFRLETGQIGKLRLEELDQVVARQTDTEISAEAGRGERTQAFLRKQDAKEKPPIRTPFFWWALAFSTMALLIWVLLPTLDQQTLGAYFIDKNDRLPFYMEAYQPEYRRLNNQAVENLYPDGINPLVADYQQHGPQSIALLRQATEMRPDYILALENLEKLYYMMGREDYLGLEDEAGKEQSAYDQFVQGWLLRPDNDSTDFFALHGLAGLQYSLQRPDSACIYVGLMQQNFPDLLQQYAGDLLYLDYCEQEKDYQVPPQYPTQELEPVAAPFRLYIWPEDIFSPSDNSFGRSIYQSIAAVNENTTLREWVTDLNRRGAMEVNAEGNDYEEGTIDFELVSPPNINSYGLLFSAQNYPTYPDLSYPGANVQQLGAALRQKGFRVDQVSEFSADEFRQAMRNYRNQLFGPNDQLMIYYSGYVYRDAEGNDFLVPIPKANTQQSEAPGPNSQWISGDELNGLLEAIPCRRLMVIIDGFRLEDTSSGGTGEQNIAVPNLDNAANVAVYLGNREQYNVQGFIIDEIEGELIIAAPYFPLDENDLKLYGPDFRVQLQNVPTTATATLIEFLDQDSLMFLQLPKPQNFQWSLDNLYQEDLQSFQPAYLYQRLSPNRPMMEGTLELLNEGRFRMETANPYLGGNLVFVDGKIAGLSLSGKPSDKILYGQTFGSILAYWENTFQQMILEQDDRPDTSTTTSNKADLPDMVFVQGGTFEMGDQFGDGENDEKPVHSVTVSDFYLSNHEVTFEEYAAYCNAKGLSLPEDEGWGKDNRPVINVSWEDAVKYCNWKSDQSGLQKVYTISGSNVTVNWSANGYRLPTEAEWEYAARSRGKREKWAGTSTETELSKYSNDSGTDDGYEYTAPVKSFQPNDLGLYDMSGNVWEWCWDWYDSGYYADSKNASDPKGPDTGSDRVLRGGSWGYSPRYCRAAYRNINDPTYRNFNVGFRLASSSR